MSIQYSEEFLGQSLGARQAANLGDGNGWSTFGLALNDDCAGPSELILLFVQSTKLTSCATITSTSTMVLSTRASTEVLTCDTGDKTGSSHPSTSSLHKLPSLHLQLTRSSSHSTEAPSGAWFVAASLEESAADNHMISPNGYDLGRDEFVGNATMNNGTISPVTNRTFATTAAWESGFLPANSSAGVSHSRLSVVA